MPSASTGRSAALRSAIERFLQERLDTKLKPLSPDDPKRHALLAKYEVKRWIGDAARRAQEIQLATHILKATHPSARGTNVYRDPSTLERRDIVGTHCLHSRCIVDAAVTDAKVLDVYGFLRNIEHEGKTLLDLMLAGDPDVLAALSDNPAEAQSWVDAFTGIARPRGKPASHTQAKQLYWLVGEDPRHDANYHLLAPLYASSLAHEVFTSLKEDLLDDAAKVARKARRNGDFSDTVVHEYPYLAVQKLGGTKPQNISQLNSERRGNNYLLASLPPLWETSNLRPPLRVTDALPGFGRQREVRRLVRELSAFLKSDPGKTVDTRNSRDEWTDQIIDELLHYGSLVQETLAPGWSTGDECDLPEHQRLWLDPYRALDDEVFAEKWRSMAWVEGVYKDFANWLNARLGKATGLPMGDTEDRHWASEFKDEQEFLWQTDQLRRRMEKFDAMKGNIGGGL